MNAGLGNAGVRSSKSPTSASTVIAANSGTSLSGGTTVQLGDTGAGSPLLHATFINSGGFLTTMTGANAGNRILAITNTDAGGSGLIVTAVNEAIRGTSTNTFGVIGVSTNSVGAYGLSINNFGVIAESRTSSALASALLVKLDIVATNTDRKVIEIQRLANGAAGANNIGCNINWVLATSDAGQQNIMQLGVFLPNAANATKVSNFYIDGVDGLVVKRNILIKGTGAIQFPQFGSGAFTGVPAYTLQVDASGNLIEGAGGGWGTTGTVATLTGNANVELAGNTLSITDSTVSFFTVDTTGGGNYFLGDLNNTNNGTYIQLADSFSGIFICTKVGAFTGASVVDIRPPNYKFGDVDISANGTRLFIDDSIQKISLISAGGTGVGGIQTNAPSAAGPGLWLLGRIIVGASVLDATQYIEAMVDGVLYKLALAQ
jgi:hypothetical protein